MIKEVKIEVDGKIENHEITLGESMIGDGLAQNEQGVLFVTQPKGLIEEKDEGFKIGNDDGKTAYIDSGVSIYGDTTIRNAQIFDVNIGSNVSINSTVKINRNVTIGEMTTIGTGVNIADGFDSTKISSGSGLPNGVEIGSNVIIGQNFKSGSDVVIGSIISIGDFVAIGTNVSIPSYFNIVRNNDSYQFGGDLYSESILLPFGLQISIIDNEIKFINNKSNKRATIKLE
jgi:UDP-3-O-[3-hydroxymyristoyl] glucosamine N-acyltransferase